MKLQVESHVWLLRHKFIRHVLQRCIVKELTPDIESEIVENLSRNIYYFANKCYLSGLDLGKICFCGDKMESRISKNSDVLQLAKIEPFVARKLTSIKMNRNIQIKAEFI